MLKALRCDTHDHTFHHITTIDQIKDAKNDSDAIIWLDLLHPTEQDLATIAEGFQLHPLSIEDATHEHQRPKVEEYENYYFVVFYTANRDEKEQGLAICEIDMFLGTDYLITVHQQPIPELGEAEQRLHYQSCLFSSSSGLSGSEH